MAELTGTVKQEIQKLDYNIKQMEKYLLDPKKV